MVSEVDDRRDQALERLKRAKAMLGEAEARYARAVVDCADLGLGNSKIARTVGVSETAIRAYLKRRGYERTSDAMKRRLVERASDGF